MDHCGGSCHIRPQLDAHGPLKAFEASDLRPTIRFIAIPAQQSLTMDLTYALYVIVIAIAAVILERFFTREIRRFGKRAELNPHVTNNMVLTLRVLVLASALVSIVIITGVPTEWLVAIAAVLGGAIGFASNKTIGNFIAGFFILAAHPLRVGDYVRIGTVEGIVAEIAINYTKILVPDNNIVAISNLQLLDRDITNFRCYDEHLGRNLYSYNFELALNHSISDAKVVKIFEEVLSVYKDCPRQPTFSLDRTTVDGRFYRVFLTLNDPKQIFEMRGKISQEVLGKWDAARLGG